MPLVHGKSKKAFEHNLKAEMHAGKPMKQSLAIAYNMKRKKKMAEGGTLGDAIGYPKKYADGGTATPSPSPSPKPSPDYSGLINDISPDTRKQYADAMKKAFAEGGRVGKQRADLEKGVHQGTYSGGSYAGNLTKDAAAGNTSISKEHLHSWAKEAHQEKLAELKSMKKPNLYAEGGEVFEEEEKKSGYPKALPKVDGMPYDFVADYDTEYAKNDESLNQKPFFPIDSHEQGIVDRIMHQRSKNFSGDARLMSEGGKVANQDEILAGFSPNEFDDLHLRDDLESSYGDDDNAGDALGDEQEDEDRADILARIMKQRKMKKQHNPVPA